MYVKGHLGLELVSMNLRFKQLVAQDARFLQGIYSSSDGLKQQLD